MKTRLISAFALTAVLLSRPLPAQDSSAPASAASADASAAVGESSLAVAASAATGIRVASGIAAVPLWMLSTTTAGSATCSAHAAAELRNPAQPTQNVRPKLNNQVGAPPKRDLSPAEAMKTVL